MRDLLLGFAVFGLLIFGLPAFGLLAFGLLSAVIACLSTVAFLAVILLA